jgi:hypothetical protein
MGRNILERESRKATGDCIMDRENQQDQDRTEQNEADGNTGTTGDPSNGAEEQQAASSAGEGSEGVIGDEVEADDDLQASSADADGAGEPESVGDDTGGSGANRDED